MNWANIGTIIGLIIACSGGVWWASAADQKINSAEKEREELRRGTISNQQAVEVLKDIHVQQQAEDEMKTKLCRTKQATKETCSNWGKSFGR